MPDPGLTLISLAAALAASFGGAPAEATWKAGVARAAITPEEPLWLAGYAARDRPAEGKIHDLWVKALALEDARGRRAVVVTSDLLGFPKAMYETIARDVGTACGIDRASFVLTSSHTHSGPVLEKALSPCYPLGDDQIERIRAYSRWLEKEVVRTVARAVESLAPARLEAGEGSAGFAANRRNNREADVARLRAEGRELAGPSDRRVPVLAVRAADGRLLAVVFGYACHNTTLDTYLWCGDYAGFAQIALERKHEGAQAMFWSGCGADQNPLPRRKVELCEAYGEELARAVEAALSGDLRRLAPEIETAFRFVDLDLEPLPPRAEIEALLEKGIPYQKRWARAVLDGLERGEEFPKSYPLPVHAWRLGEDQLWIALGGEVVVDYALRFAKEFGPRTWVAGYTDDVMAYIPSRRIQEEGGYESGAMQVYGLPAPGWTRDVEDRIAKAVRELAERVSRR